MRRFAVLLLALLISGCGTSSPWLAGAGDMSCPAPAEWPAVLYAGPYYGVENLVPPSAFAHDMACAQAAQARLAPEGYLTVFGSSRIGESSSACAAADTSCDAEARQANDVVYAQVRRFAALWTARHGRRYPIMTGGGPGLMLAANQGASDAGGLSVAYTTYYDRLATGNDLDRPMGADVAKALNVHVSHGLVFSSVVTREAAMILHSAAMVIAPGGTGTEWETFQVVETLKSRQLRPVPVYLLGDRERHWKSLTQRLDDMVRRQVIRADEVAFIRFADTPERLMRGLEQDLNLH